MPEKEKTEQEFFPLISIGMPVYNGEKYIRTAIESILNQDYKNIELIISDNGSIDKTCEICKEYQEKDSRIKFYQNQENLGAAKNFKRVFDLSKAEYFMWAAHDDYFDKSFINKCLNRLKENSEAILCCSEVNFINDSGMIKNEAIFTEFKNIDTTGMDIPGRIRQLLSVMAWVAIYGVIRRSALEKVLIDNPLYGFDVIFLLELLFLGDIIKVPEKLFYYRISEMIKTPRDYMEVISPANIDQAPDKPYTFLIQELFKTVISSELDYPTKIKIYKVFGETLEFKGTAWLQTIMNEHSPEEQTSILIRGLLLPEKIFMDHLCLNDKNFTKESLTKNENSTVFKAENYFYNNGLLLLRQEKYRDAIDSFAKSIELGLNEPDIFNNLALCLEKLGDNKTAQIYFKKADELRKLQEFNKIK